MRRARLEEEGLQKEEDRDHPKDIFAVYLYPTLAACTIGDLPSPEEIRTRWPESEVYRWKDAVEARNPQWFGGEARSIQEEKAAQKKTSRRRGR